MLHQKEKVASAAFSFCTLLSSSLVILSFLRSKQFFIKKIRERKELVILICKALDYEYKLCYTLYRGDQIMSNFILEDMEGNQFISIVKNSENELTGCELLTHCLVVVKVNDDYLLGWNKWRNRWEIFGGCIDNNESARECIAREGYEELGILNGSYEYIGLMKFLLKSDYFSPEERIEYGGLYGITLRDTDIESVYNGIQDRDEIVKLALYSEVKDKESIAPIDECLLKYY